MKKSQMEVDFDKWLSGYTGTCSDNHALYQAFCAGYQTAQQGVQLTGLHCPECGDLSFAGASCERCGFPYLRPATNA